MGRFWIVVSRVIVTHPGLILVGSFLVLAIPAWHGSNVPITYDMLAELNQKRESVQGMELLKKHFLVGETGPIVVLAYHRGGDFDTQAERVKITRLAMELKDFTYKKGQPIDHIRCLTNPLGDVLKRKKGLGAFMVRGTASSTIESKHLFLSSGEHAGEVTRFELVTNFDPFSQESIEFLDNVDEWLNFQSRSDKFWGRVFVACSDWKDVDFDFVGATAQIRDLDAVNRSDTFWVGVYVALAVLIVLIFLTRKPLISLYLIFTVVFGYLVSLGLTHLFFSWYYAGLYHGLDWKLKIFLFVILVAVGEDYNIYLVTRVFEEQRRRGPLEGLREAVIRTGGIITSCGVIMAGTFGSMATGTLRSMIELGFAMSLGVLLDTFIIRTILVPSFLALLARWGIGGAPGTPGPVESRGDARPASRPGVPGARPDAPTAPHYESVANDLAQSSK
jgi:RND superfamily putative drug exporter